MTDATKNLIAINALKSEPYMTDVNGVPVICLPEGWRKEDCEHLLPQPRRIIRTQKHSDLASFVGYTNRFKMVNRSIVEVSATAAKLTAVARLDYHEPANSGAPAPIAHWCSHDAVFETTITPAWDAWTKGNGRWMKQSEFADLLYQNQVDIEQPSGAELLEIVHTLKATAKGEFRDFRDLSTGSSELVFRMQVSAQGGTTEKPVSLPKQCGIIVKPFYGCPLMILRADILLTIPKDDGGPVMLAYRFYRLDDCLDQLYGQIVEEIEKATDLPVYR